MTQEKKTEYRKMVSSEIDKGMVEVLKKFKPDNPVLENKDFLWAERVREYALIQWTPFIAETEVGDVWEISGILKNDILGKFSHMKDTTGELNHIISSRVKEMREALYRGYVATETLIRGICYAFGVGIYPRDIEEIFRKPAQEFWESNEDVDLKRDVNCDYIRTALYGGESEF